MRTKVTIEGLKLEVGKRKEEVVESAAGAARPGGGAGGAKAEPVGWKVCPQHGAAFFTFCAACADDLGGVGAAVERAREVPVSGWWRPPADDAERAVADSSPGKFESSPGASTNRSASGGVVSGSSGAAGSSMPIGQARTHRAGDLLGHELMRCGHCSCWRFKNRCLICEPVDFVAQANAAGTGPATTPGSTIRAMAGALDDLATLMSWRTDETWCRELAQNLRGFAAQLPTQDGGAAVKPRGFERCSWCDRAAAFKLLWAGALAGAGGRLLLCELHIGDARRRLRVVRVEAIQVPS